MQVSGFRIYFLEPGYFFSKILSEFRKKIVALQITRQNYEPYLPSTAKKDEDMPKEATQSELQQAANILDNLLKF